MKKHTILNTRPADQAKELTLLLQETGADVIELPCINIIKTTNSQELKRCDYAIFLSANTVPFAKTHWKDSSAKIIAIGSGTQNALEKAGFSVDVIPEHFSSEGLLELPELTKPHQKKILIFCGEDGRKVLADTLKARGAVVSECISYTRACPHFDNATQLPTLIQSSIDLIISTSAESLNNLVTMLSPAGRSWLFNKQLLVISPKMAELAKQLGFSKPAIVAKDASNAAIVEIFLGDWA